MLRIGESGETRKNRGERESLTSLSGELRSWEHDLWQLGPVYEAPRRFI